MWGRFSSHSIFILLYSCDFAPYREAHVFHSVEFVYQLFWDSVFWPVQCAVQCSVCGWGGDREVMWSSIDHIQSQEWPKNTHKYYHQHLDHHQTTEILPIIFLQQKKYEQNRYLNISHVRQRKLTSITTNNHQQTTYNIIFTKDASVRGHKYLGSASFQWGGHFTVMDS